MNMVKLVAIMVATAMATPLEEGINDLSCDSYHTINNRTCTKYANSNCTEEIEWTPEEEKLH